MNKRLLILLFAGAVALVLLLTSNGSGGGFAQCCELGVNDSDGDGFSDGFETYIGTSPLTACLRDDVDPSVQGFPPDLDNDGWTDTADVATLTAHFGETIWGYHGLEYERFDLHPEPMGSGTIDTGDLTQVTQRFGTSC